MARLLVQPGTAVSVAANFADVDDPELTEGLRLLNDIWLRKLAACDCVLRLLKANGKSPLVLDADEREAFIWFWGRQARAAKMPSQAFAAKILLNWTCPGWQAEDPELFGLTAERPSPESWAWRTAVLKRDGNACRSCGATDRLHAHHIVGWAVEPSLRLDVSNGVTLCKACHSRQHSAPRGVPIWY